MWFHRTFSDPQFRSGPFQPPQPPAADTAEQEAQLRQAMEERREWEQLAAAVEADKAALAARLAELQGAAALAARREAARRAADQLELTEAATRQLIDAQLRRAGWEADSTSLRHGAGTRPERHRNLAIAEWPTGSGPADPAAEGRPLPAGAVSGGSLRAGHPGG